MLRKAMGIKQRELAERAALSVIYVKKLESGERDMTRAVAIAVANATEASVDWLMGEGKTLPIQATFYELADEQDARSWFSYEDNWTKEMAESRVSVAKRKSRKQTQDAIDNLLRRYLLAFNELSEIISHTFRSRNRHQVWTVFRCFDEELRVLHKRFKVKVRPIPYKEGDSRRDMVNRIASRLGDDLKAELAKCTNE